MLNKLNEIEQKNEKKPKKEINKTEYDNKKNKLIIKNRNNKQRNKVKKDNIAKNNDKNKNTNKTKINLKTKSNPIKKKNNITNIINTKFDKRISSNMKYKNKYKSNNKERYNYICNTHNNINSKNSINEKLLKNTLKNQKNKIENSNNTKINLDNKEKKEINIIHKIILLIDKKERCKFFNDDELNSLEYKNAIKIDFRTYCEFYFSLLKQTHLIIFTFFVKNDYNLFLLKLSLFLISFALFLFMNALFFNDDSMHRIYEDKGKYNIIYQIPQMLYSTIVSQVISSLLELLSLTQDEIVNMKEKGDIKSIKKEMNKVIKRIKIKCFIYFIISVILLLFFWYYLSVFCAVYKNTQFSLIKDTFISYITSMIYPFLFDLFPGIFRIIGLRNKIKCLYITNNIITKIIGIL